MRFSAMPKMQKVFSSAVSHSSASHIVGVLNVKKTLKLNVFSSCAQDWIRTSTSLRTPPPQSGLSTNFNTWAEQFKSLRV